jgi:hypothetical protein
MKGRPLTDDECALSRLLTSVLQSDSAGGIGPVDGAPYSRHRHAPNARDSFMAQLARFVQIAAVLMAIAFFAVALTG